eukprot:4329158-Alexandrium_andersonii.AAC.1
MAPGTGLAAKPRAHDRGSWRIEIITEGATLKLQEQPAHVAGDLTISPVSVSYTHLRAHETSAHL